MRLKAFLICDDVRVEAGGTLTLVGVYNDRLIAGAGEGPIVLPRLAFLVVIADLTGVEQIGFRQHIARVGAPPQPEPLAYERHDRSAAEHNFVFGEAPMPFDGPGAYEAVIELEVRGKRETFRNAFTLERALPNLL